MSPRVLRTIRCVRGDERQKQHLGSLRGLNGILTVGFAVIGAAVKEDSDRFCAAVAYLAVVDLDVGAPFGGYDTCTARPNVRLKVWYYTKTDQGMKNTDSNQASHPCPDPKAMLKLEPSRAMVVPSKAPALGGMLYIGGRSSRCRG